MCRIFSTSKEVMAASVILLPILFLYHKIVFHNVKKTLAYFIFTLYLAEVSVLVGFPSIIGIKMIFSFNFIPFRDMLSDFTNSCLNIMLFVPLGILLPCLWSEYRIMRKTVFLGFITSLGIEILQIFTLRATDVNDLMTNVTGTIIGYFIGKVTVKHVPWLDCLETKEKDIYLLYGTVVVVMFFIHPNIVLLL